MGNNGLTVTLFVHETNICLLRRGSEGAPVKPTYLESAYPNVVLQFFLVTVFRNIR